MEEKRLPLFVLAGPTGIGKTELSLTLAKALGGEIISADSMQVYHGMDIGTAKLPEKDRQGIPHHLLDILSPAEESDVTLFQRLAKEAMQLIRKRGRLPMLVGGTGFYLQAVIRDIDFNENARDLVYLQELTDRFSQECDPVGPEAALRRWDIAGLSALLLETDPESAAIIPPENVKRVLRALEFFHATGEKISSHNAREKARPSPWLTGYFLLELPREELYERIDKRVELMLGDGLLQEAKGLYFRYGEKLSRTAAKAIGYQELYGYFRGEYPLEEAVRLIKRNTRHYAKRQLTWFNREEQVIRISKQKKSTEELAEEILARWSALIAKPS